LLLAEKLKGRDDFVLLAAGTDGSDGPGDAAGALIDGMTIERGRQIGLDSSKEIMHANAGYYLAETGDLIDTGPTGTNVMDLVIAVKLSPTLA
jgi:hydroxypyruvate reductase